MLVLSRKMNESIDIGSDIEIYVLSIKGDRVRLGIRAPKDVKVLRREITERLRSISNQGEANEKSIDADVVCQ